MTQGSGWYPDPDDFMRERWWDGTAWTEATRGSGDTLQRRRAPRRGFALGTVAVSLAGATLLSAFAGSIGADPSILMMFSVFVLMPAATIVGVIGIVFSSVERTRSREVADRKAATSGLTLSIVGAVGGFPLMLISVLISVLLASV